MMSDNMLTSGWFLAVELSVCVYVYYGDVMVERLALESTEAEHS